MFIETLLLALITNGAPILIWRVVGSRANWPVDFGLRLPDGNPLFGESKTWRGVAGAILAGALCAPVMGIDATVGAAFGVLAMAGDLLSSFIKRRWRMRPSDQALALDQIPEIAIPILVLREPLQLDARDILFLIVIFFIGGLLLSRLLYRLKLRKKPY